MARDLGISDQTIYTWRRQDRVGRRIGDTADKAAYSVTKHAALALAEWLANRILPQGHQGLILLSGADAHPCAAIQ